MTDASVGNAVIYSAQVLLVVVSAAIGAHIVAPVAPRPRLVFWRAVVAACLLLPLWPARRVDAVTTSATIVAAETVDEPRANTAAPRLALGFVPWLLLSGAAARGTWLGLGLLRLRGLRVRSVPAVLPGRVEALKRRLAPQAELRWDDHVGQPLTFGLRRPVVLLPRRLCDLSPEAQLAVMCHEFVHVSRRDWAWRLLEEVVQTAFWFHPAMWWALGQVELSREETVDELVVAITASRQPYMNALVIFAEARPELTSAIPYVRRRHLASRIKRLSQETAMSSARLTFTGAALAIVILGSSLGAVSTLPLYSSTAAPTPTAIAQAGPASAGPRLKPKSREPLTFRFRNAPLKRVLSAIGTATGINISYDREVQDRAVTVQFDGVTLEQALNQLMTMNQLSYRVSNERSIRIVRRVQ